MTFPHCIAATLCLALTTAANVSAAQLTIDGVRITDPQRAAATIAALEAQAEWSFDVAPELAPLFVEGLERSTTASAPTAMKLFSDPEYQSKGFPFKAGCGHGLYTSASQPDPTFSFDDRDTWWSGQQVQRCSTEQHTKVVCFTSDCKNGAAFITALIYQIRPTGRQIKLSNPLTGMPVTVYAKERQYDEYMDVKTFGYN